MMGSGAARPAIQVRRAIHDATAMLAEAAVASPRGDAEELAAHVLGTSRGRLPLIDEVGEDFPHRYAELVHARARRVPLQHLIGTAYFGEVTLQVGPGVFIPRPETEVLLEWAIGQQLAPAPIVVDLCTGSGALAIALARHLPSARIVAVDNSPAALGYARRNSAGTRVEAREGDVTDPALFGDLDADVDLVVANPPYLPLGTHVETEVGEHDPPEALFGGPDGLALITPIVALATRLLKPGGLLAVEHDDSAAAAVKAKLATAFDDITGHSDLAGRPRFVTARRKGCG